MDHRTWLWAALALSLPAALVGCGGGKADVTGRVTHKGKAVAIGTVIVRGPDGIETFGPIQPDGAYTVEGVTPGAAKIGVVSRDPAVVARAAAAKSGKSGPTSATPSGSAGEWFPLPEKYESPDRSGVTTTLKGGANSYNIDLP